MADTTDSATITTPSVTDANGTPTAESILANAQLTLTTLTQLADRAQAAADAAKESQQLAAAALADAQAKLNEISTVATQTTTARTQIADEQGVIATKSAHIQGAQEHADKVRSELDKALTSATQQANAAAGQKTAAETSAQEAAKLLNDLSTTKATASSEAAAIAILRQSAEASAAVTKALADRAATTEERLTAYEKRLAELDKQSADHLETITSLLPGATSGGLAHAFDARRKTFLDPRRRWQWIFVSSIVVLVLLTATGLWQLLHTGPGVNAPTYDELLRVWFARLPVAAALVWLAVHASREAALAKRLEEDYGYKASIAASFEGFRKQMTEITEGIKPYSPLAALCDNTLTTIGAPPGRIYDKHALVVSPTTEVTSAIKAAVEAAKNSPVEGPPAPK